MRYLKIYEEYNIYYSEVKYSKFQDELGSDLLAFTPSEMTILGNIINKKEVYYEWVCGELISSRAGFNISDKNGTDIWFDSDVSITFSDGSYKNLKFDSRDFSINVDNWTLYIKIDKDEIQINKKGDEWYLVYLQFDIGETYDELWKCDQIDGLIKFLEDRIK